jgi:hypothetical protein
MSGRCRQFTMFPNMVITRRKRPSNRAMTRIVRTGVYVLLLSAIACDGRQERAGSPVPGQRGSVADSATAGLAELLEMANRVPPQQDHRTDRLEVIGLAAYEWTPEGYRWVGPLKPWTAQEPCDCDSCRKR